MARLEADHNFKSLVIYQVKKNPKHLLVLAFVCHRLSFVQSKHVRIRQIFGELMKILIF